MQSQQAEGPLHLPQLQTPPPNRNPADAPAHVHLREEEERRLRREQAEAAARDSAHLQHPHGLQSLGVVHLSPRQRIIYGEQGGTGHATK